jgi:hypothetical protein
MMMQHLERLEEDESIDPVKSREAIIRDRIVLAHMQDSVRKCCLAASKSADSLEGATMQSLARERHSLLFELHTRAIGIKDTLDNFVQNPSVRLAAACLPAFPHAAGDRSLTRWPARSGGTS